MIRLIGRSVAISNVLCLAPLAFSTCLAGEDQPKIQEHLLENSKLLSEEELKKLSATSEELVIDGQSLTMGVSLWRDFMPPSTGSPLHAAVIVMLKEGKFKDKSPDFNRIWVVNGKFVWESKLERTGSTGFGAGGGPKWEVGTDVFIVLEIIEKDGKRKQVKISKLKIMRTS